MARQPRIHVAGAVYHVIARGNNREKVFEEAADKEEYLQLLRHYKEKFPYQLWAYALMDNHVHLLIRVSEQPLAKIMQGVQLTYTQHFNKKYGHVGHVFQQRYKAKLCRQDKYLLALLRYIHYNPVKAGITADLNYRWSSHHCYLQAESSLVDTAFVLGLFAEQSAEAIKGYREFMSQADLEAAEEEAAYLPMPGNTPTTKEASLDADKLEDLLQLVSTQTGVAAVLLCGSSRQKQVVEDRRMVAYLAQKYCRASIGDIAGLLHISAMQVSRYLSADAKDQALAERFWGSGPT